MADNKYISVKVLGNPDANSGCNTIAMFNSPLFTIHETQTPGSEFCYNNQFVFTIKIEPQQVVYKIRTQKVKSFASARQGDLIIGFSIPKGYKLEGNVSPYDVLIKLKESFLERCTSFKEFGGGFYEFNKAIDTKVLDDIAQTFTLVPHVGPHRPMTGNAVGYINASDQAICQLMNDVQYLEFAQYREIVVANSGSGINCIPITNLAIPRQQSFRIVENGLEIKRVNSINEQVTIEGQRNPNHYRNISECFTISELKAGKPVDGVVGLDIENEVVNIDRAKLSVAIERTIRISVTGSKVQGVVTSRDLEVKYGNIPMPVQPDCSIKLVGSQLDCIANPARFAIIYKGKVANNVTLNGDMLSGVIQDFNRPMAGQRGVVAPSGDSDLRLYKISLVNEQIINGKKHFLDQTAQGSRLPFSYYVVENDGKILAKANYLYLTKSAENRFESTIALPTQYAGRKLGVCIAGYRFESDVRSGAANDITELKVFRYAGLDKKKKKGGSLLGIVVTALLFLLIGIAGGGFAGYKYHEKKKSPSHKCETCKGAFKSDDELKKHIEKYHNFKCDKCDKVCTTKEELDKHKKEEHQPKLKCDKCNREFDTKEQLKEHKKTKHVQPSSGNSNPPGSNKFMCSQCKRSFATKDELNQHKAAEGHK